MVSELLPQWIENIFWGAAAFGRPFFEEILGSDHCQHNARPVCNSVAEKGSKVGGGIRNTIKYDPHDEHSHGGNTQRMLVKKGPAGPVFRHSLSHRAGAPLLGCETSARVCVDKLPRILASHQAMGLACHRESALLPRIRARLQACR